MQLLRLPPYPLSITYDVPEPNTDYILVINEGTRNVNDVTATITSSASSQITYVLPDMFNTYDESYALTIYDAIYTTASTSAEEGDIVVEDNLEVMRPYVNPNTLGTTATEIKDATYYEGLARSIIDSIVPAYENNELVWDYNDSPQAQGDGQWNYLLTKDKTAIIKDWTQQSDSYIRQASFPRGVPLAYSDSIYMYDSEDSPNTIAVAPGVTFPMGWNYLFHLATGYKVVPYDIKDATLMLIDDLKCGRLDYHKRYVLKYQTDQYRVEYDKGSFFGTGNLIVDKILEKYITNFGQPGVL